MNKIFLILLSFALFSGLFFSCPAPDTGINWGEDTDPLTLPVDNSVYSKIYYIDPVAGSNSNNGLSDASAFENLDPFSGPSGIYPSPGTLIAIKAGTVLRMTKTFALRGGTAAGWVTYGSYGTGAKPVIAGSVFLNDTDWTLQTGDIFYSSWAANIDTADGRSASGIEQGPGNLWFFDADTPAATMTGWGFRKQSMLDSGSNKGDWYYDAANKTVYLKWDSSSPPVVTEAAVNRNMMTFSGQSYLIIQDLDFRYGGGYVLRGSESAHLRFRRLDMSFCGGGTKNGEYVRLGNAVEFNGNTRDAIVSECRMHQLFDTGIDPQNTGSQPVIQRDLLFRNNIISYAGLASVEIWLRPDGSALSELYITNNTFLNAGRGWGYEQHDHAGQSKVGADIVIFENRAYTKDIFVQKNVFYQPKLVLMSEYRSTQTETRNLVNNLNMDSNLFDLKAGDNAAVLFDGSVDSAGNVSLGASVVYTDLAAWKASSAVPGKDANSVQAAAGFTDSSLDAETQDFAWIWNAGTSNRPQRFGNFALAGNYARAAGDGWGATIP